MDESKNPNRVYSQMRLDSGLHAKLKVIAAHESRSLNAQVEYFIKQGIERYERNHGPIELDK